MQPNKRREVSLFYTISNEEEVSLCYTIKMKKKSYRSSETDDEKKKKKRKPFSEHRSREKKSRGNRRYGRDDRSRKKRKQFSKILFEGNGRIIFEAGQERNGKKIVLGKIVPGGREEDGKIEKCSWKRSFEGIGQIFPGQTKTGQPKTEEEDIVRIQGIERIFSEKRIETGKDRSRKIVPRKSGTTEETEE